MADVSPDGRDRGQLILVSGLLMTVGLVALILLVNTVIYTGNLATRNDDLNAHEALTIRETTVETIGEFVAAENRKEFTSQSGVEDAISRDIDRYDGLLLRQHAAKGTRTRVANVTLHEGRLVRQADGDRPMTNESGTADWTLATNVERVRDYELRLTNVTGSSVSDAFAVEVTGAGGEHWRLLVHDDGGAVVSVKNGSETVTTGICPTAYSSTNLTVDLTAGTINGTECAPLGFATNVSAPYEIAHVNGHRANGTYALTVNTSAGASVETANFDGPGPSSGPYWAHAVYSAGAELRYESSTVTYRVRFRAAPDESG